MTQTGIVLDIPGPWPDRTAFLADFAEANGPAVVVSGPDMFSADRRVHAAFDVMPHDPALANAMWIGAGRSLDRNTMDRIAAHKSVVQLVVTDTGPGVEEHLRILAAAVRKAGGLAVRVHYSGLSHDWKRWDALLGAELPAGLFQALVVQVPYRERGRLCSFGMVQFGLADGCVADAGIDAGPAWVLFEFNIHLWQTRPPLEAGHTFSRNAAGAQRYVLKHVADRRYPDGHEYVNPNGVWEMDPGH
ncbi:hypothetical protein Q3C01_30770 [Bradyrhizobium sp. UFLA05-109]